VKTLPMIRPDSKGLSLPAGMLLLALGILVIGGLGGCAAHKPPPATLQQSAGRLDEMGPAPAPASAFLLAQAESADPEEDPFADPDDPFADPTDEEDLDYLEDLEDEAPLSLIADPLEPLNRVMFHVNDRLYFWVLKPVARGYRWVVPAVARRGVKNFFYNLGMPIRVVNNLFQGQPRAAGAELGRFVVNTTEGILGFGNPAARYPELMVPTEDLGQTFGSYGIGNGLYLYLPFFGPSSLRDALGRLGDAYMDPVSIFNVVETEVWLGLKGLDAVNETSFRIGDYETLKEAALDPYDALRNGYVQIRKRQIQEAGIAPP